MQLQPLLELPSCIEALTRQGVFITDMPAQTGAAAVLAQLAGAETLMQSKAAAIGRNGGEQRVDSIRQDKIHWLEWDADRRTDAYLQAMDSLRQQLNQQLFLGLFDYECHLAHYPVGAFYKKHRDAFADQNTEQGNRKVSTILYLNEHWQPGDGGELVIYSPDSDQELVRVEPRLGTLVVFLSEEFPHEVLPANKPRWSLTGWFRTRGML